MPRCILCSEEVGLNGLGHGLSCIYTRVAKMKIENQALKQALREAVKLMQNNWKLFIAAGKTYPVSGPEFERDLKKFLNRPEVKAVMKEG